MDVKKVTIPTNLNNKLSCNKMMHVSAAPAGSVYESVLASTIIEIHTADGSCAPTQWKLDDLCRIPLDKVQTCFTWTSHGMDSFDFIWQFMQEHPNAEGGTPMAVYFYSKIQNDAS